jgi:hypothetical protein
MKFHEHGIVWSAVVLVLIAGVAGAVLWQKYNPEQAATIQSPLPSSPNTSLAESAESITDSGVPQDAIPSLDNPSFVPATQAIEELGPDGTGLAVVRGGAAKFYPYQILAWHEVANDTIAGLPIAATYCSLCNVGVVYERVVSGQELSFGVSGKLQELDSLLFDRQSNSLWSQVTGEAVSGAQRGQKLTHIDATAMSTQAFVKQYPRGLVLSKFTGHVRNYDVLAYGDYATQQGGEVIIARRRLLHPKTEVVGINAGGKFKAYPIDVLKEKGEVVDVVGGVRIKLALGGSGQVVVNRTLALVDDSGAGQADIKTLQTYWFMWQLYHPDTTIYK